MRSSKPHSLLRMNFCFQLSTGKCPMWHRSYAGRRILMINANSPRKAPSSRVLLGTLLSLTKVLRTYQEPRQP